MDAMDHNVWFNRWNENVVNIVLLFIIICATFKVEVGDQSYNDETLKWCRIAGNIDDAFGNALIFMLYNFVLLSLKGASNSTDVYK